MLPQIVKDLYQFTSNYYIFTNIPVYRHMSLDIVEDMNYFKELEEEVGSFYSYFTDKKIPFFEADGDYDFLDLTRYCETEDDCPIVHFNHEEPSTNVTLFPSVKRFLELMTIELESGDSYDSQKLGDYERYLDCMDSRGTSELKVLLNI